MEVRPYGGNDNYIFLSYSHKDLAAVIELAEKLQGHGYNVWFDEGIDPGTEWDDNIASHIEKCAYFIAYITESFVGSQNCRDEINYAGRQNKERLLVFGEEVDLPGGMRMRLDGVPEIHRSRYRDAWAFYDKLFCARGIDACRSKASEDDANDDGTPAGGWGSWKNLRRRYS